MFTRKQLFC